MLVLHQFAVSPFCDKIRRVLRYKGIPFSIHEWPLTEVPAIREKNPTGKLPFIEWEGEIIADSTDIALEVERRVPQPPLLPADERERALVLALEDWADESLYFYEMCLRFGAEDFARNLPKVVGDTPREVAEMLAPMLQENFRQVTETQGVGRKPKAQLRKDVERLFSTIDRLQAETGYVVGRALSLADIAIVCQAECIADSTIGQEVLAQLPSLRAYFERVDRATYADRV